MKMVCGWCRREMGGTGDGADEVSHGICPECADFFENNRGVGLREFVAKLGAPVLIVGDDIRVESANAAAEACVDLKLPEIEGLLVGDVLECAHARLPEGCGKAGVCVVACALRQIVMQTFATGRPMDMVEARQEIWTGQGPREMRFWFSSALVDGRVLLRIDRVQKVGQGRETFAAGSAAGSSPDISQTCGL
ncbi:MAG: hypothetical protein IT577_03470 [Verrucomicrobiae bacterium]|nr:hypothetical protein [Verrucomicrobiae bacterium]